MKEVMVSQTSSEESSTSADSEESEEEQLEKETEELPSPLKSFSGAGRAGYKWLLPFTPPAYKEADEDKDGQKGVIFRRSGAPTGIQAFPVTETPYPNNPGQVVCQQIALTLVSMFDSFAESSCLVEIIPCGVGTIKSNVSRLTGLAVQIVYVQVAASAVWAWKALPSKDTGKQNFGDADQTMPVIKQLVFKNANKYYKEEQLLFKSFADLRGWL